MPESQPADRCVETRPSAVSRIGCPAATLAWIALIRGETSTIAYAAVAIVGILSSVSAWRSCLRLEDGVLYQRGLLRAQKPLVLDDVTAASFRYEWTERSPRRELRLWAAEDVRFVTVGWWRDWRPFVRAVADELSTRQPDGTRRWRITIDRRSQARLDAIAREHAARPT